MRKSLHLYNGVNVFIYQRTTVKSIQMKAFGHIGKHEKKIRCKRKVTSHKIYYFILHRE